MPPPPSRSRHPRRRSRRRHRSPNRRSRSRLRPTPCPSRHPSRRHPSQILSPNPSRREPDVEPAPAGRAERQPRNRSRNRSARARLRSRARRRAREAAKPEPRRPPTPTCRRRPTPSSSRRHPALTRLRRQRTSPSRRPLRCTTATGVRAPRRWSCRSRRVPFPSRSRARGRGSSRSHLGVRRPSSAFRSGAPVAPTVVSLDERRRDEPREWNVWALERVARDEARRSPRPRRRAVLPARQPAGTSPSRAASSRPSSTGSCASRSGACWTVPTGHDLGAARAPSRDRRGGARRRARERRPQRGTRGRPRRRRPPRRGMPAAGPETWFDARVGTYGPGLYGQNTACGQRLTPTLEGVAHGVLPCGAPDRGRVRRPRGRDARRGSRPEGHRPGVHAHGGARGQARRVRHPGDPVAFLLRALEAASACSTACVTPRAYVEPTATWKGARVRFGMAPAGRAPTWLARFLTCGDHRRGGRASRTSAPSGSPALRWPDDRGRSGTRRATASSPGCGSRRRATGSSRRGRRSRAWGSDPSRCVGLSTLDGGRRPGDAARRRRARRRARPVVRRRRMPQAAVAVAMSGGVDSAVALLRAGAGHEPVGVTLRLWLDPDGARRRARLLLARRGHRGAEHVPRARPSARDARPARGVPARGRRRRSSRGYARGETPNPCIRCNGSFRFAELLALRAAGRARRGSRPGTTRGSSSTGPSAARPRRRSGEGPVVHARPARPAPPRPDLVPARRTGRRTRRARRRGARASTPPSAREPGGVLPRG